MFSFFGKFKYMDIILAVTCFLLLLVGLTLIYSTSLNGSRSIFYKQLLYAFFAIGLFVFFAYFDYKAVARFSRFLYPIFILMLLIVLKVGFLVLGARRWFNFRIFLFQPAEFMKSVIILVLARFFALRRGEINTWKSILISFIYALIPILFIAKEPDLGSAIIIFVIWLGMLFLSTVNKKVFVYIFLAIALLGAASWKFALHDYQKRRVETFINPSLDPRGSGYNVKQATIAVGSGEFFGRGLGKGLQSQLKFLPERQTDFIFASASEELGFVGSSVILILFFFALLRLLRIYFNANDDIGRFIVAGVFCMMLGQVVINVGMNMAILPVTGIPLPILSYGGSSLFTVAIALGLAEAVAIRSKGLRLG